MTYEEFLLVLRDIVGEQSGFSIADGITIAVAILTVATSIVVTVINNINNRKMNTENIKANVISNARIEWIQSVRNVAAELIQNYFSILTETDSDIMLAKIIESRKLTEKLILYFGPEVITEKSTIDQFDPNTNDGKNDWIVKFLGKYSDDLMRFHKLTESGIVVELADRAKSLEKLYLQAKDNNEQISDEQLTEMEDAYKNAQLDFDKANVLYVLLYGKLTWIRDFIRIYLKIEWNKAKQGEYEAK